MAIINDLQSIAPLPICSSNQLAPRKYGGEFESSVTSQTFGSYLLVPGTQLNKQQLTTAKVLVRQVGRPVGRCPTWGELVQRVDIEAK